MYFCSIYYLFIIYVLIYGITTPTTSPIDTHVNYFSLFLHI